MGTRRLYICIFFLLLPLIFSDSSWAQYMGGGYHQGYQQVQNEQAAVERVDNGSFAQMNGECTFDDAAKAKIAPIAKQYVNNSLKKLNEYNAKLEKVYKDGNGACHDLVGDGAESDVHADAVWNSDLNYNDHAQKGAKYIDEHYNGGGLLGLVQQFNKEAGDTDYNIGWLASKTLEGINSLDGLVDWYKNSTDYFDPDECSKNHKSSYCKSELMRHTYTLDKYASEMLEQVFHYHNDCKYAYMPAPGQLVCVQTAWFTDGEAFKCGGGSSSCSSASDLEKKIKGSNLYTKCKPEIEELAKLRKEINAPEARIDAHKLLSALSGEVEVICQCPEADASAGENAQAPELDVMRDCIIHDEDMEEDGVYQCKNVSEYSRDMQVNPVGSLMETVLEVTQKMSKTSFDLFHVPFEEVLGIALAIYILFVVLKTVSSPAVQKTSELLQNILIQGAKVALAILLLNSPEFLYKTFVWPIVEAGLDVSNVMTFSSDQKVIAENAASAEKQLSDSGAEGYLPANSLQLVVGAVNSMQLQAATMPAIGASMLCNSWVQKDWKIFPHISMLIEGAIIYIFGWIICLVLGFYLIDCVIQLTIVCALMPFFILSWPFKITSGYTKQGWDMLLNTTLTFAMMGIVTKAISILTTLAISDNSEIIPLLDAGQSKEASAILEKDFGGKQLIMLVVCCVMCLKMPQMVSGLVGRFAGGADLGNMGGKLLGAGAQIAMAPVKKALKAASAAAAVYTGGASAAVSAGVKAAGTAVKQGVKQGVKQATKAVAKQVAQQTKNKATQTAKNAVDPTSEEQK